mgnify:CR=1 FL=1
MVSIKKSRYAQYGSKVRYHKGKPYNDLVSSRAWKNFLTKGLESFKYKVATIPASMEYRPDLIANAAYGSTSLWWLICTANGIMDPSTELKAGKQILIPII